MGIKKLEATIKEIAKFYFLALKNIGYLSFSNGQEDQYSPFYKYYLDVERAFSTLNTEQKKLINNEFFYDAYSNWWISFYKPSVFKRKRKEAIRSFVEVFYEIH